MKHPICVSRVDARDLIKFYSSKHYKYSRSYKLKISTPAAASLGSYRSPGDMLRMAGQKRGGGSNAMMMFETKYGTAAWKVFYLQLRARA